MRKRTAAGLAVAGVLLTFGAATTPATAVPVDPSCPRDSVCTFRAPGFKVYKVVTDGLPKVCYGGQIGSIKNRTSRPLTIFRSPNCQRGIVEIVGERSQVKRLGIVFGMSYMSY
ncbi:hypothetical protein [Streptomyces abikoensis]|uniref:hypothetical protein n=1 Tax=Streptomyces abikoensis TaxID=97398 RepID=UPI0036A5E758